MSQGNAMVPSTNWAAEAESFGAGLPPSEPQGILCVQCYDQLGITTPPARIVIVGGESRCLEHLNAAKGVK